MLKTLNGSKDTYFYVITECATCTPDAMRKKASPIVAILQNRRTDKP